ncbi:Protein PER1 [Hypsizygus marmoreus]|uniref:Post-GPI attachment to proteins factor 3 n=1 Tax=Hypsizygus marmoreus TaxID=39966 RepID=A0A369JG43_HYPMA|nr:Protein PER1 [Hypsizygus marmoreus]
MNLLAHVRGASKIIDRIPRNHPMKKFYLVWSFLSVNAWFWSSVFHTRDKPITEKLDYFCAASSILFALYYTVIRLFHLYPSQKAHSTIRIYTLWTSLCGITFLSHISYLSLLPRFDYAYNIVFNLIIGLAHNALWLLYSLPISFIQRFPSKPKSYRPPYASKAAVFVALTTAATALEVFDFPPLGRVIDAHALWHLATVPIGLFWKYIFLCRNHRRLWTTSGPAITPLLVITQSNGPA